MSAAERPGPVYSDLATVTGAASVTHTLRKNRP